MEGIVNNSDPADASNVKITDRGLIGVLICLSASL